MSESPHQLKAKIDFLHQENQQLRNTIEDLQIVIKLKKQSMFSMIDQDITIPMVNQQTSIRENDNTVKTLKLFDVIFRKGLKRERICIRRLLMLQKRVKKKLISELQSTISEFNHSISQQTQKISQLEKQTDQFDNILYIYILFHQFFIYIIFILKKNIQKYKKLSIILEEYTILLHEEKETLHQLISIQLKIVTLINKVITDLQNKNQGEYLDEQYEKAQNKFVDILAQIQQSRLPTVDLPNRINSSQSPINTDMMHSSTFSPFPDKTPQIQKKNYQNLNQTFDIVIGINDDSYQQNEKQEIQKRIFLQSQN